MSNSILFLPMLNYMKCLINCAHYSRFGFVTKKAIKFRHQAIHFMYRNSIKQKPRLLFLWTVPFLTSKSQDNKGEEFSPKLLGHKNTKQAVQEADELFESNNYQDVIAILLPYKETGDVEVLWRLSRAQYNHAQSDAISEPEKRQLIQEAFDAVTEALERDNSHWAVHKWMSVLLDARATYDGIKARVQQLENVKNHMLRAVELNPNDATTFYMLGSWSFISSEMLWKYLDHFVAPPSVDIFSSSETSTTLAVVKGEKESGLTIPGKTLVSYGTGWCYQIADMPWIQRKIASTIFATPPTSSFEEALEYFTKAEDIEPRFYSQNLLMLGKTLMKLERNKDAAHFLTLARDYQGSTHDDNLVKKEAREVLNKLKIE